jgi:hypothetical protein
MKGKGLIHTPFVLACSFERYEVPYQNLGCHSRVRPQQILLNWHQELLRQQVNLTTTNNLDFGSAQIIEPHAKRYRKQFGLLPILEDLTHIVKRTLVFHSKKQWHIRIQRYLIIGWFWKQTKSSLAFSIFVNKPPHLGMFYAIHVILYHFFCSSYGFLQYKLCPLHWNQS